MGVCVCVRFGADTSFLLLCVQRSVYWNVAVMRFHSSNVLACVCRCRIQFINYILLFVVIARCGSASMADVNEKQ